MKRKVPTTMTECFELIERKLLKGPWVMGEQYTICDPYLFTIGTWIEGDGVDTTKLPLVMENRKRMLTRPAVQKAVATEGPKSPRLGSFTPFSYQTHGGCLVRKEQKPPTRSRRDGRRA